MLKAIARIVRTPDLLRKIAFTLGLIAVYRMGAFVPAPGVDYPAVQQCLAAGNAQGGLYSFVNMFSGGALLQVSVFALGIMPYITASIIVQLLRVVIPRFEQLHQEGPQGQATLTQYTRYLTLALALLQATTMASLARTGALLGCSLPLLRDGSILTVLLVVIALTTGCLIVMWFGERITENGVGNGMSLLIFTSIAATFPSALGDILRTRGWGLFLGVCALGLVVITCVVFVEQSQRRIPVQYAKRMVGRRTIGGTSTYIPLKVNMAGVIPIIFASSMLMLPTMIAQFAMPDDGSPVPGWVNWVNTYLARGDHPIYMTVYFLLIVAFTYFYVSITFNPEEVSDNMKRYGGFIPGIRAGRPTENYLRYVLSRITLPGALYLGIVSMIPLVALVLFDANQNFPFGGPSLLIMVGVGLDTVKQIDAQLQQRHYEGLLRT